MNQEDERWIDMTEIDCRVAVCYPNELFLEEKYSIR